MKSKSLKDRAEWNTRLIGTCTHSCICGVGKYWPDVLRNILQAWVVTQCLAERQAVFPTMAAVRALPVLKARTCVNSVSHRCQMLFPDVMHYPGKEITWQSLSPRLRKEGAVWTGSLDVWEKQFRNLVVFTAGQVVLTSCESRRPAREGPPSPVCVCVCVCVCDDEGRKWRLLFITRKTKHVLLWNHFTPVGDDQANSP